MFVLESFPGLGMNQLIVCLQKRLSNLTYGSRPEIVDASHKGPQTTPAVTPTLATRLKAEASPRRSFSHVNARRALPDSRAWGLIRKVHHA